MRVRHVSRESIQEWTSNRCAPSRHHAKETQAAGNAPAAFTRESANSTPDFVKALSGPAQDRLNGRFASPDRGVANLIERATFERQNPWTTSFVGTSPRKVQILETIPH